MGNSDSFSIIFRTEYHWLVNRLRYKFNCHENAEDIASESFLKLFTMPSLGELQQPRAMLTTISKHIVYELSRRKKLENAYLQALESLPEFSHPSPETRHLLLESLVALDKALDSLSDKARKAFFYSQLDGMTYAQISAELNVSVSTVRQYMAKALAQCYLAASEL